MSPHTKDENGKEIKKSQSKVTKNCRCENQEECEHEYVLTDDGAGTIVKSGPKRAYPADGGSKVLSHCLNLDYTD